MENHEQSSYSQRESQQHIDLQDSQDMNQDQRELFLNIRKSRSNDSFLGKLIGTTPQIQKRPLVLNLSQYCSSKFQPNDNISTVPAVPPVNYSIFKKVKKQKKHNKCDYQKNICGYITKKIIREFIGITFQDFVEELCKKYYCSSDQARKFYLSKIQYVTGPSHISALIKPQQNDSPQLVCIKFAFRDFFDWFLKQRYLRYLLLEGKMTDKKAYIEYKNKVIFSFLQQDNVFIQTLKKKLIEQKNQELKMSQQMFKLRSISSTSKRSKSSNKNIILTQRLD